MGGQTSLHCAALQGHSGCCELLLQYLADACLCDSNGATPLHAAVTQPVYAVGSREREATAQVLILLLTARADPGKQDFIGRTPLELAAAWGVAWPAVHYGSLHRGSI